MTDQTPDPVDSCDEVRAADENLDAAIRRLVVALAAHEGHDPGLLTDWTVVGVTHVEDGSTVGASRYTIWGSDHTPLHARLGLLEYALIRARGHVTEQDARDE